MNRGVSGVVLCGVLLFSACSSATEFGDGPPPAADTSTTTTTEVVVADGEFLLTLVAEADDGSLNIVPWPGTQLVVIEEAHVDAWWMTVFPDDPAGEAPLQERLVQDPVEPGTSMGVPNQVLDGVSFSRVIAGDDGRVSLSVEPGSYLVCLLVDAVGQDVTKVTGCGNVIVDGDTVVLSRESEGFKTFKVVEPGS